MAIGINNNTDDSDPVVRLGRRVADLERLVRELASARTLSNATIDSGGLQISNGGALRVLDPNTSNLVLYMGTSRLFDGSGRQQMLFELFRDDGTPAMYMGDFGTVPGHTHQQSWALCDRTGNVVFADDTLSGVGIAVPYVPMGPFMSNSFPTDTTTSNTYVTLQTAIGYKMNPQVYMQILVRASDGTTAGLVRVIDQNGLAVGTAQTIAAGAYSYITIGPAPYSGNFKDPVSFNIQAARTAGAGTIGVRGIAALGVQT